MRCDYGRGPRDESLAADAGRSQALAALAGGDDLLAFLRRTAKYRHPLECAPQGVQIRAS